MHISIFEHFNEIQYNKLIYHFTTIELITQSILTRTHTHEPRKKIE